jgi:NADH-quinone oxidoreductase subunit C
MLGSHLSFDICHSIVIRASFFVIPPKTMPATHETIDALQSRFPGLAVSEFRGDARVVVPQEQQYEALEFLKESQGFNFLCDITCVDLLNLRDAEHRFQLVYLLTNCDTNERITLLVMLDEPNLTVPSAVPLWEGADWLEREVWDMFGIRFQGHPDLRRILLPEEFTAHPLRKDYPLQGRGERHNFHRLERAEG